MIKQITQKEIAKHMNVSISTVSKALNDSYEISQELRTKIQSYARQNSYRPNPIALSLKNKSTKTIALILPEIVHYFFSSVIEGIEEVVEEKGYNLIISLTQDSLNKEIGNIHNLVQKNVDGFILSLSKETQSKNELEHLKDVVNLGLPLVLFDRIEETIDCDKVISNDYESAVFVTNELIKEGRKKIGLITTQDYISVGTLRTKGYMQALKTAEIEVTEKMILKIKDVNNSDKEIKKFINNTELDAVIGVNEKFSAEALSHLKGIGKTVPDDVSIITFGNGVLSTFTSPKLSALDQQGFEMGRVSAELLIKRLMSKKKHRSYSTKTEIVKNQWLQRDSTKKNILNIR